MKDYTPIIIIGAARSGTNMLRDILASMPRFGTWDCDEIGVIWRHKNFDVPHDCFTTDLATPEVTKFIQKEFDKMAKRAKCEFLLEKTCANSLRLAFVYQIFPNAKYLIIHRDGQDAVASSMLRWNASFELKYTLKKLKYVPWRDMLHILSEYGVSRMKQIISGKKQLKVWGVRIPGIVKYAEGHTLAEVCAEQWNQCVSHTWLDLENIPLKQKFVVRYESFVSNPESELSDILKWIGLEDNTKKYVANVTPHSVGKYKRQLTNEDLRKVRPIIGDMMKKLNYNM